MLLLVASVSSSVGEGTEDEDRGRAFTIALIGDYNYDPIGSGEWLQSPKLIDDINAAQVKFTVHDGDIKGGESECTDEIVSATKAQFNRFKRPLIYLFGDNEWTDCHGYAATNPSSPFIDPLERLQHLRKTFYATNRSQGTEKLKLTRQADVDPRYRDYVENVRWERGGVIFVGLNVPGSNNNADSPNQRTHVPSQGEFSARNQAVLDWIGDSFRSARKIRAAGILLAMQGNPDFANERANRLDLPRYHNNGFNDLLAKLQRETVNFDGQVVLVHGDTHYFRMDKPLTDASNLRDPAAVNRGRRLESFTRVETFGTPDLHWVKVRIDADDASVFRFEPMIVDSNRASRS